MAIKTTVVTPLGTFKSVVQAAAAHKCDRATLMNRFKTNPEEYQRTTTRVQRVASPTLSPIVKGARWPITWTQYRFQADSVKEEIYNSWCAANSINPESESAADAFFDDMDQVSDGIEIDAEESELDDTAVNQPVEI